MLAPKTYKRLLSRKKRLARGKKRFAAGLRTLFEAAELYKPRPARRPAQLNLALLFAHANLSHNEIDEVLKRLASPAGGPESTLRSYPIAPAHTLANSLTAMQHRLARHETRPRPAKSGPARNVDDEKGRRP